MKKKFKPAILATLALTALVNISCNRSTDQVILKDHRDSISWAVGQNTAVGMQKIGYDFNTDIVLRAIEHTLNGSKQPLSEQSYNELLADVTLMMQSKYQKEQQEHQANIDRQEEKLFDDLLKNDPDVKQSPDGIYYKVLKPGKGDNVKIGQVAVFDFRGYIMKDNKLIDQTYEVREPIETLVGGNMFPGLQKGMTLMNAGSIYRLYFPSKLAFGSKGSDVIPPNTAIYYDVELHSFHK